MLARSSAAERKRLERIERMLALLAEPDERTAEIDLVASVRKRKLDMLRTASDLMQPTL